MTDLQQQQITSYGSKGNLGRYPLATPPPAAHVCFVPEQVNTRYGWLTITSPERRYTRGWHHPYVPTRCVSCGKEYWTSLESLSRGKSKGCQHCSQPRKIPVWLEKRLSAAKSRCENPSNPEFKNYGGRGIRFDFPSVVAAGVYLLDTFGVPDRAMQIDRIDTNRSYAPGNLRFCTRAENQANRRITVLSEFRQEMWPYAETTVRRMLASGMTRKEIISSAETAVFERRKNWRTIEKRLRCMTYEMPESIIVTPYRASSSTTADTAGA